MSIELTETYKRDREAVIQLTKELVQIPSVYRENDPEGNE